MQDFKYFKKIISKNILFMMILVLLLVGVSERIVNLMVANDSYVLDRNKSIFRILREPENSVDIIVLGDSLGMTSISPMAWWGDYGMTGYVDRPVRECRKLFICCRQHMKPRALSLLFWRRIWCSGAKICHQK